MRRSEAAIAIGAVVATTYGLLIGGTAGGVLFAPLRLASVVLVGTALGLWWIAAGRDPTWRPRSVLLPVLLLGLGSMAISAVFSRSQRISAENLAHAVILVALYGLLVELVRRPVIRERIVAVAALTGIVLSVAYIASVFNEWVYFWRLVGHLSSPPLRPSFVSLVYDNPGPVLAICVLLGGVAVAWAGGLERRIGAVVATTTVALTAMAAFLSGTRAGWLGIAVAVAAVGLLALTRRGMRIRIRTALGRAWGSHSRLLAAGLGLAGILVVLALVALGPGVLRRVTSGGEELRASFYVVAIRMFLDAPLIGVGPGMWAVNRIAYTQPPEPDYSVPHAHDIYLQSLAELGLIGMVVGALVAALMLWLLRDGLRSPEPWRRRWAWVAAFTGSYFAIHGVFDYFLNLPAVLIAAAIPLAVLDATAGSRPLPNMWHAWHAPARGFLAAAGISLALAVGFGGWVEVQAIRAGDAVGLANAGRWAEAQAPARQAVADDPGMPANWLVDGLVAAHNDDLGHAEVELRVIADFGDLPEAWVDLASIELRTGEREAAAQDLARAARLGTERPAVALAITDVALGLGDQGQAIESAAAAIAVWPSIAADPWWTDHPAWGAIYHAAVDRSTELADPEDVWEIYLMAGDPRAAVEQVGAATDPLVARDVIDAWAGDTSARLRIDAACSADPVNGPVSWCARLASRAGDADSTARYQAWGRIARVQGLLGELRMVTTPTEPTVAGSVAFTYPVDVFRRFGLWDLLVPGLPHLVQN